MDIYVILNYFHSYWRWIILVLLLLAVAKSVSGWLGKRTPQASDKKLFLFAMVALHVQFILGLALYFMSARIMSFMESGGVMKDSIARYWVVEHMAGMLIGVVLVTIGFKRFKKSVENAGGYKSVALLYLLGLIVILASIPWPFRNVGIDYIFLTQ
jgi:uncharacterized membrane protein